MFYFKHAELCYKRYLIYGKIWLHYEGDSIESIPERLYMESYAWRAMHGELCMESYVWRAINGELCMQSYVWRAMHRELY